jgi:phosphoserine phosphatase RsbU/P
LTQQRQRFIGTTGVRNTMDESKARLACFELWGGNRSADHPIELPGLAGWVYSSPLDPTAGGGDVHYFSVCRRGMISRIAVADVAGHGSPASSMAEGLRSVLQRHTDNWDQSALMQELNEAFMRKSGQFTYATATVLGYYAETGDLLFSSAGHPPPLWYRAADKSWHFLEDCTPFAVEIEGLPLGLIRGTTYAQRAVKLEPGDVLVLYTDGITEAFDPSDNELGPAGLMDLARTLPVRSPVKMMRSLLSGVVTFRGEVPRCDDDTVVVLRRLNVASE